MASRATGRWQNAARNINTNTLHVKLRGLPKSALPSDIRRLCAKTKVENIASVALDYHRFIPTRNAYLTFTRPDFVRRAVKALDNSIVGGSRITAMTTDLPGMGTSMRTRGEKGKAEAAERGLVMGDGPGTAVAGAGKSVVIWGLPGRMTAEAARHFLRPFKLASEDSKPVVKIELPEGKFSLISKLLVRLASVSEAHRLVRKLHMTYHSRDQWGTKYQVRARVVY